MPAFSLQEFNNSSQFALYLSRFKAYYRTVQTLLDFYQFSFSSGLVKISLILAIYCMHGLIGKFFFPNYGFFIQAFIGSSFSAAITTSLCAFSAIGARYFVYLNLLTIVILNLYNFRIILGKSNADRRSALRKLAARYQSLLFFLMSAFILFVIYFRESARNLGGLVTVNSHQAYYAGVPLEILQADYSSRLRILDNYPLEYPRFHFFHGAGVANLLPFVNHPNFFDYELGNICILAGLVALICECVKLRYTRIGITPILLSLLFGFSLLANQFQYMILGSNFPSIAPIICILILTRKNLNKQLTCTLLIILSCTASRNFFPAFLMIGVVVISAIKVNIRSFVSRIAFREILGIFQKIKTLKYFVLVFSVTALTMFGTGESLFGLLRPKTWITQPIHNLLPMEWLALMSPSLAPGNIEARESILTSFKPLPIYFFLFSLLAFVFLLRPRDSGRAEVFLWKELKFRLLLTIAILVSGLSVIFYWNGAPELMWFLCYFAIPISVVLGLFEGYRRRVVLAFILASLGEFVVFIAGASVPNWVLIEWMMVFIVIERILDLKRVWQGAIVISFLLPMFLIPSSFLKPYLLFELDPMSHQTHRVDLHSYAVGHFRSDSSNIYCRGSDEEGLLWSLKGIRSVYNPNESHSYTVTADFGKLKSWDARFINSSCNNSPNLNLEGLSEPAR